MSGNPACARLASHPRDPNAAPRHRVGLTAPPRAPPRGGRRGCLLKGFSLLHGREHGRVRGREWISMGGRVSCRDLPPADGRHGRHAMDPRRRGPPPSPSWVPEGIAPPPAPSGRTTAPRPSSASRGQHPEPVAEGGALCAWDAAASAPRAARHPAAPRRRERGRESRGPHPAARGSHLPRRQQRPRCCAVVRLSAPRACPSDAISRPGSRQDSRDGTGDGVSDSNAAACL